MVLRAMLWLVFSLGISSTLIASEALAQAAESPTPVIVSNGTSVLNASQLSSNDSLQVKSGATAIIVFSSGSSLKFDGNITNSGNIFAVSGNSTISSVTFQAQNIFNNQGALFSTVLPASLSQYAIVPNLNLSLIAVNQIVNAGRIASAGSLSMSAASIVNTGVINAAQNLSIVSQLGSLSNSGVISANAGNLSISSLASQNLMINNLAGSLQALLGTVNFSTAASSGILEKLNIDLRGGNILAKELNFSAINGTVDINADRIDGVVNISACAAHLLANTPTLSLGQMTLSGDPTFYNTGGSINISSNLLFNPVQFVSAPVGLAIVAMGDITASASVTQISNNAAPSASWPTGAGYNGDIMIIAGAAFTATPTDASQSSTGSFPAAGDTSSNLIITGASSSGGSVQLANVSINSQAGLGSAAPGSANSGNVTILAYGAGAGTGNISIGSITTGETNLISNDVSGTNGSVTIVGSGNITVGGINTSGNYLNANLNNGNIMVASASIDMLQMPDTTTANSFAPVQTTLQTGAIYGGVTNTAALPGSNTLYMTSLTGIAVGNTLVLDPQGPAYEQVTVSALNPSSNSITTNSAVLNNHSAGEAVYLRPSQAGMSNTINAKAGDPGSTPMIINNNLFAPNLNNLSNGQITISQPIVGTGAITLATGASGSVQVNNSLSLTVNPTTTTPNPTNFLRLPVINISGGSVTVAPAAAVSSSINGCDYCPNSVNIATASLTNNGSIGSTSGSNMLVNVYSSTGLNVSGSGNFAVPAGSVIELSAADQNVLNLNSALNFSTGTTSAVILDAQRSSGAININGNLSFKGAPVVSINSPNITAAAGTQLSNNGGSFLFGSGYTAQPLTVNLSNSFTLSGAPAAFTPFSGQNLVFQGNATFTSSNPVMFQTNAGGAIQGVSNLTLSGNFYQSTNPNGMIQGFEFQPYIGGRISSTNSSFVQYAAYPYQVVLALLANDMAVKDSKTGIVAPPFQYVSTYTQVSSTGYTIPAAKQLGLRVSAGVFVDINADTLGSMTQSAYDTALYDTQAALQGAAKYGNVLDIVVGNEDIIASLGSTNASYSMTTLQNLIQGGAINIEFVGTATAPGAQPTRNSTVNPLTGTNFSAATLPVVTRQKDGVLNLVTDPLPANATGMTTLMNALDGYVYSNTYPFFDESTVVPALIANPAITQTEFTTLVTTYLDNSFTTNATNFTTAGVTAKIRIGETGWATPMTKASVDALKGYYGASLPQQSIKWASWYYPAVQNWSSNFPNPQTKSNGVIVANYFASYDEPWKGVIGKAPNGTAVNVGAGATKGLTTLPTNNGAIFYTPTLTPMSVVINPNLSTMEIQNYFNPNPGTNNLPISSSNFPSALVFNHATSEQIVAGSPQEPFFGIFVTTGSNLSTGSIYRLTGDVQKYSIVPLNLTKLSSAPPPPVAASAATAVATSSLLQVPAPTLLAANFSVQPSLSSSLSNTTVLPTDINPERVPGENAAQGDSFAQPASPVNQALAGAFGNFNNNILPNPQGNNIELSQGNAFFLPDHNITVQTPLAKVNIAEGAAVMIFQTELGLSVFNLFDNKAGDVAITVGDQSQELSVGRQVTLGSDQQKQLKDILPSSIALRDVQNGNLNTKKAFSSEFSHVSAFSNFEGLRKLIRSDDKYDRQKAERILKTAAALTLMNKKPEAYK